MIRMNESPVACSTTPTAGRCFCGAEIAIADMDEHIYGAHMEAEAA
jgi:hypothetical protein